VAVAALAEPATLAAFRKVWLVDFEFSALDGERQRVICMVARELRSRRTLRLWGDELRAMRAPPFTTDGSSLVVAYYASAEVGCFLQLGWPLPERVLDLFAEFRNATNGLVLPAIGGKLNSLLCALSFYGIPAISFAEKKEMQQLAVRGEPWTDDERAALLAYCETDVNALELLLPRMLPHVHVPFALHRGRYMKAVARMEHEGIPLDVPALEILRRYWPMIKAQLVAAVDLDYGVYEGTTFKVKEFERWLAERRIAWPRLATGALALDGDAFSDMAKAYPAVGALAELRHAMSALRLESLAVGSDGRNRCLLSAFAAKTGRNQPSNSRFIFGPSKWLRCLIQPPPGFAIAYCDWEQQEIAIAAALSGDVNMQAAYNSADFYLSTAKLAGAAPIDATKKTHKIIRDQFKSVCLGVLYGLWIHGLADRLGESTARARELLEMHRQAYPTFWAWSEAAVDYAVLNGHLDTVFGWRVRLGGGAQKRAPHRLYRGPLGITRDELAFNPRSLRNFPVQANAAEMMRYAAILATERGVSVCGPVHDAFVVMAPADRIDEAVVTLQAAMAEASRIVLRGFELRSDAKIVRYPARYVDERGAQMWNTVWRLIRNHDPSVVDRCLVAEGSE
jgi:hypothetical protein